MIQVFLHSPSSSSYCPLSLSLFLSDKSSAVTHTHTHTHTEDEMLQHRCQELAELSGTERNGWDAIQVFEESDTGHNSATSQQSSQLCEFGGDSRREPAHAPVSQETWKLWNSLLMFFCFASIAPAEALTALTTWFGPSGLMEPADGASKFYHWLPEFNMQTCFNWRRGFEVLS